ncbi:MAG: FeoB-associated Cys-rich membrane protein [Flavobacteriaceae bacterium]|nr:FeoB-associated Cys-rich membrane protein [Flavobacteriaceae bacterium]
MIQEIIIYIALALAVFFLLRKFVFKRKKKKCGSDDCGCN